MEANVIVAHAKRRSLDKVWKPIARDSVLEREDRVRYLTILWMQPAVAEYESDVGGLAQMVVEVFGKVLNCVGIAAVRVEPGPRLLDPNTTDDSGVIGLQKGNDPVKEAKGMAAVVATTGPQRSPEVGCFCFVQYVVE